MSANILYLSRVSRDLYKNQGYRSYGRAHMSTICTRIDLCRHMLNTPMNLTPYMPQIAHVYIYTGFQNIVYTCRSVHVITLQTPRFLITQSPSVWQTVMRTVSFQPSARGMEAVKREKCTIPLSTYTSQSMIINDASFISHSRCGRRKYNWNGKT